MVTAAINFIVSRDLLPFFFLSDFSAHQTLEKFQGASLSRVKIIEQHLPGHLWVATWLFFLPPPTLLATLYAPTPAGDRHLHRGGEVRWEEGGRSYLVTGNG